MVESTVGVRVYERLCVGVCEHAYDSQSPGLIVGRRSASTVSKSSERILFTFSSVQYAPGRLDQLVDRSLSMREVRGSKPRMSILAFLFNHLFPK